MNPNIKFRPNSSFAIAAIAERWDVPYDIALNYAAAMLAKHHRRQMNFWHVQAAAQVAELFDPAGPRSQDFYGFHNEISKHIRETRLGLPENRGRERPEA